MIKEEKQIIKLTDGREITISTGKLAKQAHGSVEVRMGDTHLLATVVSSYEAKEGVDFLPLTVDYREKFAADGRFPGGFLKREARPTDNEILVMRLVDRILRPMFPSDYHAEVQIMISLNSHDPNVNQMLLQHLLHHLLLQYLTFPLMDQFLKLELQELMVNTLLIHHQSS